MNTIFRSANMGIVQVDSTVASDFADNESYCVSCSKTQITVVTQSKSKVGAKRSVAALALPLAVSLLSGSNTWAAGPRSLIEMPALYGQAWKTAIYDGSSPDQNGIDLNN